MSASLAPCATPLQPLHLTGSSALHGSSSTMRKRGLMMVYSGSIEALLCFLALIALLFVIPLIPARVGERKGYSFAVFYVFGLFAFLPALITALVVKKRLPSENESGDRERLKSSGAI